MAATQCRDRAGRDSDPKWKVIARRVDDTNYRVTATGKHYSIERQIARKVNRIVIRDTFSNKTDDVIGIILARPGHHGYCPSCTRT
ncbi:MAG: hypothetical protein ACYTG0_30170 [Planctomycetota bacterium]|jgi:hypothetical protein